MARLLLDTDIVSALMRRHPEAIATAARYLSDVGALCISAITRYEILRGLEAKLASTQIVGFHRFCDSLEILPVTDLVLVRAARIYGDLRRQGQTIGDADILIGATCLEAGRGVATNNVAHFERIDGLAVENWLA